MERGYIATAIPAFFYIRMLITNIISFGFLEFGFTAAMGV